MSGGKGQFIGNPSNHQMCKIVKEGEVYFHSPSQKGSAIILAKYSIMKCTQLQMYQFSPPLFLEIIHNRIDQNYCVFNV